MSCHGVARTSDIEQSWSVMWSASLTSSPKKRAKSTVEGNIDIGLDIFVRMMYYASCYFTHYKKNEMNSKKAGNYGILAIISQKTCYVVKCILTVFPSRLLAGF